MHFVEGNEHGFVPGYFGKGKKTRDKLKWTQKVVEDVQERNLGKGILCVIKQAKIKMNFLKNEFQYRKHKVQNQNLVLSCYFQFHFV